jgi:hypothetical protein
MDLVARTNILLWTWIQSLRSAKKLSLFIPFLLFALLQTVILVLFLFFYSLPLAGIFIPLVRRLSGESALHYPQLYMHLPRLFSIANVWLLNPLMGWLFIGAATFLFAAWYRGQFVDAGRGLSMALGRTVPLLAVGLVEWGAVKLVVWLLPSSRLLPIHPRRWF